MQNGAGPPESPQIPGPGELWQGLKDRVAQTLRRIREDPLGWVGRRLRDLGGLIVEFAKQNPYVAVAAVWGFLHAIGKTVRSGTQALLFSFGRAKKVLEPGFHLLIPHFQIMRVVPTRSRTLDLGAQRVTTRDGLVYRVDANLVYRVADIKKALIQIDDLVRGMRQSLGLSVQEVLRDLSREDLRVSEELDGRLEANMARRLEPWGVVVERAGFGSITPSPRTLRLTQLVRYAEAKRRECERLVAGGVPIELALPLLGSAPRVVTRRSIGTEREYASRRRHHLRRVADQVLRRAEETEWAVRRQAYAVALQHAGLRGVLGDALVEDATRQSEAGAKAESAKEAS